MTGTQPLPYPRSTVNLSRSLATVTAAAVGLGVVALATPAAAAATTSPQGNLVISQVYGGGGNAGAPIYSHDFVELLNRGTASVSTAGLSLQSSSAAGPAHLGATVTSRWALQPVELAPGQRLLVQGASGSNTATLPSVSGADEQSTLQLDEAHARLALVTGTAGLGCNSADTCTPAQVERIVDLVGYGNATWHEGKAPAPALRVTTAAVRAGAGCTDSDDNSADFATSTAPGPRGSNAPATPCAVATASAAVGAASEPVIAPADELLVELTQQLEVASPAQVEELVAHLVDAAVEQTTAPVDTAAVPVTASAPQSDVVAAPTATRHPGCNGIEIAVTKVKAGSAAKTVLAAKHAEWSCSA